MKRQCEAILTRLLDRPEVSRNEFIDLEYMTKEGYWQRITGFTARISELRKMGHDIESVYIQGQGYVYRYLGFNGPEDIKRCVFCNKPILQGFDSKSGETYCSFACIRNHFMKNELKILKDKYNDYVQKALDDNDVFWTRWNDDEV